MDSMLLTTPYLLLHLAAVHQAIAVARGYVANEGGSHQVAFQPYLRHQAGGRPQQGIDPRCVRCDVTGLLPAPYLCSALSAAPYLAGNMCKLFPPWLRRRRGALTLQGNV